MLLTSAITLDTPIQYESPLPPAVDVVVIGAGIIGIATALEPAQKGSSVLVCEKGRVAGEQSSRNWGWVRQTGRDPAELPLMIESLRLWKDAASRTGENSLTFSEQGVMYVSRSDKETSGFEDFIALAKTHGVTSVLLTAAEVVARTPNASEQWKQKIKAGLWTASDGRVEPWGAVTALARVAHKAGVHIKEQCAVQSIDYAASGQHVVETEAGSVNCSQVLIASGMWSSQLMRSLGLYLPQLAVKATVARLENTPRLFSGNIADNDLALAQRLDGGYTMALGEFQEHFITRDSFRYLLPFRQGAIGKFHKTKFRLGAPKGYPQTISSLWGDHSSAEHTQHSRVMNPIVDKSVVDRMLVFLKQQHDNCEAASASHAWAGMIETTPDFVPVLDQASTHPGIFIATGFSGHGFGIGLGAGRVMADLILGNPPGHDLNRFRLSRFTDGSKLELGPI